MKNNTTLLAIYPSSLGFGYVAFETPNVLIDYGMVKIYPMSNSKILDRIEKIMEYINPSVIVLSDCNAKHYLKNKRVQELGKQIEKLCYDNKLSFASYTRDDIKLAFAEFNVSTKYEIACELCEIFPELESRKPSNRKVWQKQDYYMGIFDALSLVVTHQYLSIN